MIYRAQVSFQLDSAFPRDAMTITPHYDGTDAQGLADALKTNLLAAPNVGTAVPFNIKVYNAQQAPPNYPLATAQSGSGFAESAWPREVALCLSYFATWNRPTYRGRLFIPMMLIGGSLALRPTGTQQSAAGSYATVLGKNLPGGTSWCLYSRRRNISATVTDWWVDDEWDTVRSRGLRSTSRVSGVLIP